ncbi:hypothetical protein JTE90_000316 [Oedothorax gibbosus]|uniref:Centrosomin N-terminal motif 1 domain-containing protein n=1 Tax=Oedothorax gibbosus TaxID=931172 RepID=A0AAV6VUS2_9ARAC|nr:hypothetical protein JTE90_000316 [Oedothorax gibbosus]
MAGYLDGQWRIGSKARGTRSPVKHASEGLLPFKCTYPVQLTDVMDQVPSVQSDLFRGAISPTRETRTLAVREFEETIAELRKENFDLKLQLYLKDQSSSKTLKKDSDEEDKTVTVQIVVDLQVENDSLKKELRSKDQLLQQALAQSENRASHVKELQETLVKVQEKLTSFQSIPLEWKQLKEDKDIFEKENEYLKSILPEKDTVIQNANAQIEELSSQIDVLEAKLAKRRTALQGIVYKYHTDIEKIPKELRPTVQKAVQAAKECKEDELNSAILELKSSLCKLMPTTSQDVSYGQHLQDESETKVSDEPTKLLKGQSTESINESEKSYGSENCEDMATIMKDNEELKSDNDEKARTIQSLNATCSELERRNIQLCSDLSEAVSKVKLLETKVNEEMGEDDDLERKYLEDCLAQSNQINHELLGHLRELETFMEDLLQHRNLDSSSIAETSGVLSRLTSFLDDTRKLSIALSEQISIHESSKLYHPNDVSTRTVDYSQTEEQSNPEHQSNRSLDDPNAYSIPQGRQPFSQLEPHTNTAETGKRRLSFTTLHNARRMDSEKVVVLGTSNNEDLILLLNEKGDPEDVLIRNNQAEHRNLKDFYGQLPRHGLDSSLGLWNQSSWHASSKKKLLGQEKSSMERWCASEIPIVGQNRCPSSDSDIWSEPDRDVSMQRIGIDVQKSPVAHKSPRRLRHRTTNESSSQKIESSSSAVKCHPLLKRRRSGDAFKSPFVCKKCLSPSKSDLSEKDRLQKVVNDLHNKCNSQENKLEETNENLKNKNKEIDALSKENHELVSYVNQLQTELEKLRTIEKEVSLGASESDKLTEVNNENTRLKNYVKLLESKSSESESILETLKRELIEAKKSLQNFEEIRSDYKRELSTSVKALEDYKQKCDKLEEEFIQKTEEIDCLSKENSELISSINELEMKSKEWKINEEQLLLRSSETSGKLTEINNENVKLKQFIKSLETKKVESDSFLEKLKQELQETRKSLQNLEDICYDYKTKLSTSSKTLEDYIEKYNMLEEKFIQKTRDIDDENNELLNSINEFESTVKEMKVKERELTLQISHSSAKLTEVSNENVKLKKFIKSMESQAFESDSVCKKLKQELEETRKRLQNLDEKCSNYEIKLSTSNQFSENLKQKYNDVANENSKFLNDISELASAKNELIRCLQDEKEKVQQILSENSNLKEELEIKSKSLTTLQSQYSKLQIASSKALEEKEKRLTTSNSTSAKHQEQSKKYKSQINDFQQDLKSTQDELAATKFYMEEMKAYADRVKQSLDDTEVSLKLSKDKLSSSETKLNSMQGQVKKHENLLAEKNKHISELQSKVEMTENQLTDAVLENKRLARQVKMNIAEQPNETVSEFYPSKGSPNVSISSETSITQERSRISSSSSVKDEESGNKSVTGKYIDIIRSLKTKLALSEQRIVILEKEKGHLREHLLAQVCKDKSASQSSEDLDNLRKDNADLHDQLQAKSSCINDLKHELFQTCNSLIDKQKEVEDLKCKLSDSQEQISETKSTNAQEGSQESIFQRSHFSSPDLGIESDPNHESSAPEQSDPKSHEGMWSRLKSSQPVFIDRSASPQVSDHASADTLHALCALQHYELLKIEVQESLNAIKSVLSRATDGLQYVSKYTSSRKSLESSTFKAIIDSGGNIVVCLYKAHELLEQFRIEPCPSIEEFNKLVQRNQEMQEELNAYLESRSSQERYFNEAMERLKQAEILSEQMEKKTTKKLVKTKKLIRLAERRLLEQKNTDISLPKYPTDEPTCQTMR